MSSAKAEPVADSPLESRFIGIFSYGSNNEAQLRARCCSPRLRGRPASLDGYIRVFGHNSGPWAGGSVASVTPKEGGCVYGRFYLMTPGEVDILDMYEAVKQGGYSKEPVMVNVRVAKESQEEGGDGKTATSCGGSSSTGDGADGSGAFITVASSAITYVMTPRFVRTFAPPSPQYLTAVYRTQTSSFPELAGRAIDICDHTGTKRSEWTHPGIRALPLEAFLLEVGLREEPSWTFPTVLGPLAARLAAAGVTTTDALCAAATSGVLLSKLAAVAAPPDNDQAAAAAAAATTTATAPTGASPTAGGGEEQAEEQAALEKLRRALMARTTVPDFTEQTIGIISRIASGQIV